MLYRVKLVYSEKSIGPAVNRIKPMIHGVAKSQPVVASRRSVVQNGRF
jgi:hypothetical protein